MSKVRSAAVYARISSDPDGRAQGVTRQLEDCRMLAAEHGWEVGDEYVDNDTSAFSGRARPEYERMLADLEAGERDAVVVYNLDRLHRRPVELERFVELCEQSGVTDVVTVTADVDLGNDDGPFMARLLGIVAAKESGRKSARIKRRNDQRASEGLPHGGRYRPYGYDQSRMVIVEDEARVVREVVGRYLAGESIRSLTMWLNDTGVPSATGKEWGTTALSNVIRSERIAGLRAHRGTVVGEAAWPPIITLDEHRRVLATTAQRHRSGRRSPRTYLLSGMLRCGKCDNQLFSAARSDGRRYVCASGPDHGGCGKLTVVAPPVEELVADGVLYRLDTPELVAALSDRASKLEALRPVEAELRSDQEQLHELAEAYANRDVTMKEWLTAKKPIEQRIEAAERRIGRATRTDALAGLPGNGVALRGSWAGLNLTRQAAIVQAVLDHAVILPGTPGAQRLDPARVQPVWRL